MTHPLTDKILHEKFNGFYDSADHTCGYSIFDADDMRAVADDQLDQVIKWLDENLSNYTSAPLSDSPGDLEPLFMLRGDLMQAMREQLMPHPLTDEICENLVKEFVSIDPDDMRAAADWQLKYCTSHVTDMLFNLTCDGHITDKQLYKLLAKFKKAMRPKTQEDFWA